MIGFSARSDGGQFALHPAFITNRTVSLHLMHFTLPGAGDGTSGDSAAQSGNAPDDPMIQIDQMIALYLRANLATMPKEGRIAYCSPAPSHPIADIFGEIFLGLHNDEVVMPQPGSVEASTLGGPAIKMTGFEQGGGDIIFTKEYSRSVPTGGFPVTEVTTIKLRHTPKK